MTQNCGKGNNNKNKNMIMVINIFSKKKFLRLSKLSSRPTQGHSGVREGEVRLYDEQREDHAFKQKFN